MMLLKCFLKKNESLIIKVNTFGIRGNLTGRNNIWSITIPNVYILHICNHLCEIFRNFELIARNCLNWQHA